MLRPLWLAFLFSIFVNLLMLTGPLYMLQVYDRVLGSRSEETLLALTGLIVFLFLMMGILDYARARVAARVGAALQDGLDEPVFAAVVERARRDGKPQSGLRDLGAVQRLMSSPVFMALFD
ncbi:MAG: type I secretion system permease/ATPase, partial [Pseudomonadota bacterium]